MTNTIGNAVAKQERPTAGAMVKQYEHDFTQVLPTHIKPDTWIRVAQGALKKGKRDKATGLYELEVAATNNLGVFLATMLDAARLGLEPGTEQFYLTARKVQGQLQILGIVGYQGLIELIYRAGAVSSVIAEVVHENDRFEYQPGRDERPHHTIDWDAEDRGPLRLTYAFAIMKDGATSKVVVLNRAHIALIKRSAQAANSEYSPWNTNPASMWLKSSVRQLAKWVPTSSEYMNSMGKVRAVQETRIEGVEHQIEPIQAGEGEHVDTVTGEIMNDRPDPDDDEPIEAEFVDQDTADWPATAHPGGAL